MLSYQAELKMNRNATEELTVLMAKLSISDDLNTCLQYKAPPSNWLMPIQPNYLGESSEIKYIASKRATASHQDPRNNSKNDIVMMDVDNPDDESEELSRNLRTFAKPPVFKCRQVKRRRSPIAKARRQRTITNNIVQYSFIFLVSTPVNVFLKHWERTVLAWASLKEATVVPEQLQLSNLNISRAIKSLLAVISGDNRFLPAKFGYLQLSIFLNALEQHIRSLHEENPTFSRSGRRISTRAIDLFLEASDVEVKRSYIWTLRRYGERWKQLANDSGLLLIVFSETAESFMLVNTL